MHVRLLDQARGRRSALGSLVLRVDRQRERAALDVLDAFLAYDSSSSHGCGVVRVRGVGDWTSALGFGPATLAERCRSTPAQSVEAERPSDKGIDCHDPE